MTPQQSISCTEQIQSAQRPLPREVIYDRAGRGIKEALGIKSHYSEYRQSQR